MSYGVKKKNIKILCRSFPWPKDLSGVQRYRQELRQERRRGLSSQVEEWMDPRRRQERSSERRKSFHTGVFSLKSPCLYNLIVQLCLATHRPLLAAFPNWGMSVERRVLPTLTPAREAVSEALQAEPFHVPSGTWALTMFHQVTQTWVTIPAPLLTSTLTPSLTWDRRRPSSYGHSEKNRR